MSLQIADWQDILTILHETVHIWSLGMTAVDYQGHLSCQLRDPWFRRNCRLLVAKEADLVKASCKLYTLEFAARGCIFKLAGLGAIYTKLAFRGQGIATDLINDVIDLCEEEGYDGIVLQSEIDPEFYAAFGFEELGCTDFSLELSDGASANAGAFTKNQFGAQVGPECLTSPLTVDDIPALTRHYGRWLREQPYGVVRTPDYWRYKVIKEQFLHQHSSLARPALNLFKVDFESSSGGYAITESFAENLRVLEIVGSESARKVIWANLLTEILKGHVKRLRGWEAVVRDLAPTYKPRSLQLQDVTNITLYSSERDWGRGMILTLNPRLEDWLNVNPSPMLELDHL